MRAAGLAIALAACGASPAPLPVVAVAPSPVVVVPPVDAAVDAGPTGTAAALVKLTELTEAMCRCGDSACASRLAEAFRTWGDGLGLGMEPTTGHSEDHVVPSEAEQQEL